MLGVPGVSPCAGSSWAALQTVPLWEPPHTYADRHRFSLRKQRFGGGGSRWATQRNKESGWMFSDTPCSGAAPAAFL